MDPSRSGTAPSAAPADPADRQTLLDRFATILPAHYREPLLVGRGGMGVVFSVLDTRRQTRVAIKMPWPDVARDSVYAQRFEREARVLGKVSHPNIVQIYDVGVCQWSGGPLPYFTMELLDASTLRARIRDSGPLPLARALDIGQQLAQALIHLHGQGIIHRDLKPSNVCLLAQDQVKLVDFGVACEEGDSRITASWTAVGTAMYAAPERLLTGHADARSDIFSLGVLLIEAITGEYPFTGSGVFPQVTGRLRRLQGVVPGVGASLESILLACAATDPDLRVGSAQEVAQRLFDELILLGAGQETAERTAGAAAARVGESPREMAPGQVPPFPHECALKFRPVRLLASGSFGGVWLAEQVSLRRAVVVKLLHPAMLTDPVAIKRFEAEALLTARISHPNVVVLLDHGVEDQAPWIAYEYLPGRRLREIIALGPLPWVEAVDIAGQLAAGLAALHIKGILHRDLKPANVVEVTPGKFKIIDLGLARLSQDALRLTVDGHRVGTPAYMAPEVLSGQEASAAADIYALAVILAQMLTGRRAKVGECPESLLLEGPLSDEPVTEDATILPGDHAAAGSPRGPPPWPAELEAVIRRAGARDPKRRYASASGFRDALRAPLAASISSSAVAAPAPGRSVPGTPAAGPVSPAAAGARTALALALVGGLLAVGVSMRAPGPKKPAAVPASALASSERAVFAPSVSSSVSPLGGAEQAERLALLEQCERVNRQCTKLWDQVALKTSPVDLDPARAWSWTREIRMLEEPTRMVLARQLDFFERSYRVLDGVPDPVLFGWERFAQAAMVAWYLEEDSYRAVASVTVPVDDSARDEGDWGSVLRAPTASLGLSDQDVRHTPAATEDSRALVLLDRFASLLLEAVRRAARRPSDAGLQPAMHLGMLKRYGRKIANHAWDRQARPLIDERVRRMTGHLLRLGGPGGELLGEVCVGYLSWGLEGSMRREARARCSRTVDALDRFVHSFAPSDSTLLDLLTQSRRELEIADAARAQTPRASPIPSGRDSSPSPGLRHR